MLKVGKRRLTNMIRSKLQIKPTGITAECVDIPTLPKIPLMDDLSFDFETHVKFKIFIDEVCAQIDKSFYTQFNTPELVKKIETIFDIWCDVATRVMFQSIDSQDSYLSNTTLQRMYVIALQTLEQESNIDYLRWSFGELFASKYQNSDICIENVDLGIMYMLATIFIETGWATPFEPVSEGYYVKIGSPAWCKYLHSKISNPGYVRQDPKTKKPRSEDLINYQCSNGTTYTIPKYYGRGFIQTTGYSNYRTAQEDYIKGYYSDKYSDIDLVQDPDLMIQVQDISAIASILNVFFGVWPNSPFTINKFLSWPEKNKRQFNATKARRIVNADGSAHYQLGSISTTINEAIKKMMTDFSNAITVYLVTSDNEKIFAVGGKMYSETKFI